MINLRRFPWKRQRKGWFAKFHMTDELPAGTPLTRQEAIIHGLSQTPTQETREFRATEATND